jgi:hypothetical protein
MEFKSFWKSSFRILRLLNRNNFEIQFKIEMMNILEITLSNILLKIWFQINIKFKLDFETKIIFFKKWKAKICERL